MEKIKKTIEQIKKDFELEEDILEMDYNARMNILQFIRFLYKELEYKEKRISDLIVERDTLKGTINE